MASSCGLHEPLMRSLLLQLLYIDDEEEEEEEVLMGTKMADQKMKSISVCLLILLGERERENGGYKMMGFNRLKKKKKVVGVNRKTAIR